jgi:hypothetical protein
MLEPNAYLNPRELGLAKPINVWVQCLAELKDVGLSPGLCFLLIKIKTNYVDASCVCVQCDLRSTMGYIF